MALIQGYAGGEIYKEGTKYIYKKGGKEVGTYDSIAQLTKDNRRGKSGGNTSSRKKVSGQTAEAQTEVPQTDVE